MALQDHAPPLQVLAMLPVAGRAAWGAEWEQGCQRASGEGAMQNIQQVDGVFVSWV